MTARQDFDEQEWGQLLMMPWVAGVLVIVSDPSWRLVGEFKAMATAVMSDDRQGPAESLIDELVSETEAESNESDLGDDEHPSEDEMFEMLSRCGTLIAERCTDDEAEHVGQWVLGVARATAEARREGGFLGFGGVRVSADESVAIARIGTALGV